ncbi:MAG TPA: hypothetical protein VLN42_08375 [Casimicrobiaceae bacterium]|nr:hypothetical protein [Casimicrobiaceae bacterium]
MVTSPNPVPPPSADWLDALLAGDAADHRAGYVTDEGFTARVMQRLPVLDALPAWRRPIVAGLWLVAAVLVATMLPGTAHEIARDMFTLFAARPFSLSTLGFAIFAVGLATWTAAALALRKE